MAINEACQVWIEQRIQEELQEKPDSGKSLREIGREIAAEIEKIFEAKVNPETLANRASVRNRTQTENQEAATVPGKSNGNQTAKKKSKRGGFRENAGRKKKDEGGEDCEKTFSVDFGWMEATEDFRKAFEAFIYQVQVARHESWEKTSRKTAQECAKRINDLAHY